MRTSWVLYSVVLASSCQAAEVGPHYSGIALVSTGADAGSDASRTPAASPAQPLDAACTQSTQPSNDPTGCSPPAATTLRLLLPQSGSVVTSNRPRFAWTGATGPYELQVCRDRMCKTVLLQTAATGNEVTLSQAIPPGYWFWRVRAAAPADSTWTSSWEMRVRRRFEGYAPIANTSVPGFSDYNGDGYPDVAVLGTAPLIYLGGPDGLVGDRVTPHVPNGPTPMGLMEPQTDVNGDGFTDLSNTTTVTVPGQSSGTYAAHVDFGAGCGLSSVDTFIQAVGGVGNPIGIGDLNGDGFGDLVMQARYGGDLMLGNISKTAWAGLHCDTCQAQQVANGDFNGDGLSDLVFADGSTISLYLGSAGAATWQTIPGITGVSVIDFNYDGFSDLVFPTLTGPSEAYEGGPNGLSPASPRSFPPLAFSLVGDFDGDGYWDYVGASGPQPNPAAPPPTAVTYGGPGDWGAPPVRTTTIDHWATTSTALVEDVNADGYDDLVVQSPGQTVMYWYAGSPSGLAATPTLTIGH